MLKDMAVMHPAAKMLVDLSAAQDVEAGDGTTSVVVIAGSLLGAADKLLAKGTWQQMRVGNEKAQIITMHSANSNIISFATSGSGSCRNLDRHVPTYFPLRPRHPLPSSIDLSILQNRLTTLQSPWPYGRRLGSENH